MKRWIFGSRPQRFDRRWQIAPHFGGRSLVFERCEDRLLLSAVSPATQMTSPEASEGGYITIQSSSLLNGTAHAALDSDQFSLSDDNSRLVVIENILTNSNRPSASPGISGTAITSQLDVPLLNDNSNPLISEDDLDSLPGEEPINVGNGNSDGPQLPATGPPGLPEASPQILPINDQIPFLSLTNEDSFTRREGGVLSVATSVVTTQQAAENALTAAVAHELNRSGNLPEQIHAQTRPVVSELARSVAFEIVEQLDSTEVLEDEHDSSASLEEVYRESSPTQFEDEPANPNANSIQSVHKLARGHSSQASEQIENPPTTPLTHNLSQERSSTQSERLDDEQFAQRAASFAQWPALATVIASYLLIERNSPVTPGAVQTPPRRTRHSQ